jgi:hypothetical protein
MDYDRAALKSKILVRVKAGHGLRDLVVVDRG